MMHVNQFYNIPMDLLSMMQFKTLNCVCL